MMSSARFRAGRAQSRWPPGEGGFQREVRQIRLTETGGGASLWIRLNNVMSCSQRRRAVGRSRRPTASQLPDEEFDEARPKNLLPFAVPTHAAQKTRFSAGTPCCVIRSPTAVEPVNEIISTRGSVTIARHLGSLVVITLQISPDLRQSCPHTWRVAKVRITRGRMLIAKRPSALPSAKLKNRTVSLSLVSSPRPSLSLIPLLPRAREESRSSSRFSSLGFL